MMDPITFIFFLIFKFWIGSIWGIVAAGLGLVGFVSLIVAASALGVPRKVNDYCLWFAAWSLKRFAFVLGEHGDLYLKNMRYQDIGSEKIKFGDTEKEFEVLWDGLQTFKGIPFGIADERDGVLFNPVHAAVGKRIREYREEGLGNVVASEKDYADYGVDQWMPGVFEFEDGFELVDLTDALWLPDGGERAEYPARAWKYWKLSRNPDGKHRGDFLRALIPVGAFVGLLIFYWQFSRFAGGQASSPDSTIGFGSAAFTLFLLYAPIDRIKSINWFNVFVGLLMAFLVFALFGIIWLLLGTVAFIAFVITFLMWFFLPVLVSVVLGGTNYGTTLAHMYFKLGLMGYNRPVWVLTDTGYEIVEYDSLDDVAEVNWYSIKGTDCGFTFDPEILDRYARVDGDELENATLETELDSVPANYQRCTAIQHGDYGGYIPKRLKKSKVYCNAAVLLRRFSGVADGDKTMKKLTQAKDEHGVGGANQVSFKLVIYSTLVSMVLASAIGLWLFFM